MKQDIAYDVNKKEIKRGNLVRIVSEAEANHPWLKVGNTLRVSSWEDRSLGKKPYICVFLSSKSGLKHCRLGIQDVCLQVVGE